MNIEYGQHIFSLGKTGAGKTVCMQYLITLFNRSVIYDIEQKDGFEYIPLGTPDQQLAIVNTVADMVKVIDNNKYFRIIYQPSIQNVVGSKLHNEWNEICTELFNRSVIALFCDEVAFTQPGPNKIMPYSNAILMLGRKRFISMIGSTRRNQELHKVHVTQSSHYFVYLLQPYDLNIYREFIPHIDLIRQVPRFHCLYVDDFGNYKILKPFPLVVTTQKRFTYSQPGKEIETPGNQDSESDWLFDDKF